MLNQCVSRLIWVSGFSLSHAPILFLSPCYSSLINFMMRKVNCRRTQPCPLSIPRVFTFYTITMQNQSKEHALLTNKNIFCQSKVKTCLLQRQSGIANSYCNSPWSLSQKRSSCSWRAQKTKKGPRSWHICDDANCLMTHLPFLLLHFFTFSHVKWPHLLTQLRLPANTDNFQAPFFLP